MCTAAGAAVSLRLNPSRPERTQGFVHFIRWFGPRRVAVNVARRFVARSRARAWRLVTRADGWCSSKLSNSAPLVLLRPSPESVSETRNQGPTPSEPTDVKKTANDVFVPVRCHLHHDHTAFLPKTPPPVRAGLRSRRARARTKGCLSIMQTPPQPPIARNGALPVP